MSGVEYLDSGQIEQDFNKTIKDNKQKAERKKEAARKMWAEAGPAPDNHQYLKDNGISSYAAKANNEGSLLLPIYWDNEIGNLQLITPKGEKSYHHNRMITGGWLLLGSLDEKGKPVCITVSFAGAARIHEDTGAPVIVAFDYNNLAIVSRKLKHTNPHLRRIIVSENNEKEEDKTKAKDSADETKAEFVIIPSLGEEEEKDLKALLLKEEDLDPVDPFGTIQSPPFNLELLPDVLRRYVSDQSELMGVDPGVMAMFTIAAATAVLDHRIQIQPKRFDPTWTEAPRLWIAVVGDPSTMKSPALTKAFNPVRKIEAEADGRYKEEKRKWDAAVKELKKGDDKPPEPVLERITVTDATVEKLAEILGNQEPRGIAAVFDELSGWLSGMDAYKGTGIHKDRAAWLTAFNGESLRIDRISRGSNFVENFSVSITGGIQPTVLRSYMNASDNDGLLPRFLLYNARTPLSDIDRFPDMQAKKDYQDLICHLREVKPADQITLREEAHTVRESFKREVKKAIFCSDNQLAKASFSKWDGIWTRLTLVLHCIDAANKSRHPSDIQVTEETALRAAGIMRLLIRHTLSFYAGADAVGDEAKELASLILAHQWERFTVKRDLAQYWKASRRMKPWEIEATLDRLEGYGWIIPEKGRLNERGKPIAYKVNAKVHKIYTEHAEREKTRRKEIREFIKGL